MFSPTSFPCGLQPVYVSFQLEYSSNVLYKCKHFPLFFQVDKRQFLHKRSPPGDVSATPTGNHWKVIFNFEKSAKLLDFSYKYVNMKVDKLKDSFVWKFLLLLSVMRKYMRESLHAP